MKMQSGRKLSELRLKRILAGYTMKEIGEIAGLSPSAISCAERGFATKRTFKKIDRAFQKIEAAKLNAVAQDHTEC